MSQAALNVVRKLAAMAGMENPDYTVVTCTELGNGYLSGFNIICVTGDKRALEFFAKVVLHCTGSKVHHVACKGFYNECVFYDILYPHLLNFQLKKEYKTSKLVPRRFKAGNLGNGEVIVLENLAALGYRTLNRSAPVPKDHIKMVLRGLGCFHGMCFAFREQNYYDYRIVVDRIRYPLEDFRKDPEFSRLFEFLARSVLKSLKPEDREISAAIERISEEAISFLVALDLQKTDQYSIITNTDVWTNNLLFKYDDSSNPPEPTEFCIIDWQMVMVAPPVIDIAYFFYTACSKGDMEMIDDYLDLYYSHLSTYMTMSGSQPESIYPRSVFLEQWKTYSRFGLIMGLLVIRNMLTDEDERVAMKRIITENKSMCKAFALPIKQEETYRERIRDIVTHMEGKGLLD